MYDLPSVWSRQEKDNFLTFTAPDRSASITLAPSKPLVDTLEKVAEELLARAGSKPEFRVESKPLGGPHTNSGGEYLGMLYSYTDPAQPGQFKYDWVVVITGGGRYLTLTVVFSNQDAYRTHGPNVARWVNGITLTTLMEVEKGSPPLTRYMLDEVNDFLDWLMQSPLTDVQRATVERELRGCWQKNIRDEVDGVLELLKGRQELAAMKPAERDVARQAILEEAVKQWRNEKDSPAAQMMIDIYDATHKPIAAGNPPLTQQNVDAFAEFLCFAAGQTAGVRATPAREIRENLARTVAAGYTDIPDEQKELIARMPLVWASIRMVWSELPEAERNQYIEGWKQSPQLVELGKQLAAAAPANPMAQQMAHQMQQRHFQMMSDMMRKTHETRMIMNSNLGGNTQYEYRWR